MKRTRLFHPLPRLTLTSLRTLLAVALFIQLLNACYKDTEDYGDYNVGDSLVVVPELYQPSTDSVEYYWDEAKIATEHAMPFALRMKLERRHLGSHRIMYRCYRGNTYRGQSRQITVEP